MIPCGKKTHLLMDIRDQYIFISISNDVFVILKVKQLSKILMIYHFHYGIQRQHYLYYDYYPHPHCHF